MGKSTRLVQTFGKLVSRFVVQKNKEERRAVLATRRRHSSSANGGRDDDFTPLSPSDSPYEISSAEDSTNETEVLSMHGFELHFCIGEGSFGKVYKVSDRRNGKYRAVKVVKCAHGVFDSGQHAKFLRREIQALHKLEHNHIVKIFQDFQFGWKHFIVLEFVEKGSLRSYMRANSLFPHPNKRRQIFRELACAINYCHQNNIAHRDLKLDNVLLDEQNHVKLCDFGFSCSWTDDLEGRKVNLCSTFCGTLDYVSPEVLERKLYDPRAADVWSLGVILYALLCLEMPFEAEGNSRKRLLRYQKSRKIRKQIWKKAPPEESPCVTVILNMLEPDVRLRATIHDLILCDWLREQEDRPIMGVGHVREFLPEFSKLKLEELLQWSQPKKSILNCFL